MVSFPCAWRRVKRRLIKLGWFYRNVAREVLRQLTLIASLLYCVAGAKQSTNGHMDYLLALALQFLYLLLSLIMLFLFKENKLYITWIHPMQSL